MGIIANREKIGENFNNVAGGIANETRYTGKDNEHIRLYKRFRIPINNGGSLMIEQGWNTISKKKDLVKITLFKNNIKSKFIISRLDLEQSLFAMSQGDEVIKYVKASARSQREHSTLSNKRNL